MRKLIISLDSYNWINHCAGMISREPSNFSIFIFNKDDRGMMLCATKQLCREAIYAQRKHDLTRIGKMLNLRQMTNLLVNDKNDKRMIAKAIVTISMYLTVSGIRKIYYEDKYPINYITKKMCNNIKIPGLSYNTKGTYKESETIQLDEKEINLKKEIFNIAYGIEKIPNEIKGIEEFYKGVF